MEGQTTREEGGGGFREVGELRDQASAAEGLSREFKRLARGSGGRRK